MTPEEKSREYQTCEVCGTSGTYRINKNSEWEYYLCEDCLYPHWITESIGQCVMCGAFWDGEHLAKITLLCPHCDKRL